jgi:hypothetical protein
LNSLILGEQRICVMVFFLTFLVLVGFACGAPAYAKGKHGIYEGELIIQALPDGRNLRIVKPLSYVDPEGRRWRVPQGMETDGASVPRFFWALFPPFRASTVSRQSYMIDIARRAAAPGGRCTGCFTRQCWPLAWTKTLPISCTARSMHSDQDGA